MNHPLATRRQALCALTSVAIACAAPWLAHAQAFPSKPITIVLPYPVGGSVDLVARSVQEPLQKALGQPAIVDAKPGASGMLATRLVARAPADGHTLLIQTPNILITPQLSKNPEFSPLQDFEPVMMLAAQPFVLLAHSSVPARNVKELIAYAGANPGKLDYGTAGGASFSRLATELLMAKTDIKLSHVPYKGVGASTQAIYTGEIKLLFSAMTPQIQQFVDQGRIRMLGVATLEPSPMVPGVEPIARTVSGFEAVVWYGLFAPKATTRPVVARLQQVLAETLASPEYRQKAQALGATVDGSSGDTLQAKLRREHRAWGEVIRKAGITED